MFARNQSAARLSDIRLEGSRVLVRPPRLDDMREWHMARAANERYLRPFEPEWDNDWNAPDYFARRLIRQKREWETGRACSFLIFKKGRLVKDELIGGININNICRGAAQYASPGYWITEESQGQGYMAEALGLVLEYGFETLNLHRFNAACLPRNERSQNLLLRAGFKKEGFAEKYIEINKIWEDHDLFGLPIERWRERRNA